MLLQYFFYNLKLDLLQLVPIYVEHRQEVFLKKLFQLIKILLSKLIKLFTFKWLMFKNLKI